MKVILKLFLSVLGLFLGCVFVPIGYMAGLVYSGLASGFLVAEAHILASVKKSETLKAEKLAKQEGEP